MLSAKSNFCNKMLSVKSNFRTNLLSVKSTYLDANVVKLDEMAKQKQHFVLAIA